MKGLKISLLALIGTLALASCHYNPLDSYSRVAPDRSKEDYKEPGLGGKFADGYGTAESPYIIRNAKHIMNMKAGLVAGEMVYFSLETDLDLSDYAWTPLNNVTPYDLFIDFEGNGHVIRGLNCSGSAYPSFFGILCGNCRNVGFIEASIEGTSAAGIIAGYLGIRAPSSANFTGSVDNCYTSGVVNGTPAGGIAGYMGTEYNSAFCYIHNCYSGASVYSSGNAGGIAGQLLAGAEIDKCYSTGIISGGVAGGGVVANAEASAIINDCVAWNTAISGPKQYLVSSSNTNSFVWNGIKNVTFGQAVVKTEEELQAIIPTWSSGWYSDGTAANGFPAFNWQVERGDVTEMCGLEKRNEEIDPSGDVEHEDITEGAGTSDSPYLIYSVGQLLDIDSVLVSGTKTYFKLMNDLDMQAITSWHPVNAEEPYDKQIDFDGNSKTISNFSCTETHYGGFFGVLYGECHDICFKNPVISSTKDDCGVLGGFIGTNGKPGMVRNVTIDEAKVNVAFVVDVPVGIVASNAYNGTFEGCRVSGEIVNKSTSSGTRCATGGYIGKAVGGTVTFADCSFEGTVTSANSQRYTGGFIGWSAAPNVNLDKCRVAGTINASGQRVGSIVGHWASGRISNTSSTASINASSCSYVGGLVGLNSDVAVVEKSSYSGILKAFNASGGIVGYTEGKIEVRNCYTQGQIFGATTNGGQTLGGICGELMQNSVIRNCYSTMEIQAYQVIGSIVGRACNGGWSKDSNFSNVVEKCIAWPSRLIAVRKNEDGGSSGAIIGFASRYNTYTDNYRSPHIDFQGSWTDKGTPTDQDNVSPSSPLTAGTGAGNSWTGFNYIYPYHGKAASSSATISSVAKSLSWDEDIWDLSNDIPTLK